MAIRGLIFDFDGLILDTETPLLEEWRAVYRRYGLELGLELWQKSIGTRGGFEPKEHLEALTGADGEALFREVMERYHERCDAQPLLPGVESILEEAKEAGLGRALASSSSAKWVERWLTRHEIRALFDAVCARDHVERVKPAPDLFLLAAQRIRLPPSECLVLEDSPNGILAAHAAGMSVVAVPNEVTRHLALPEPDLVVTSLGGQSLLELLSRLEAARALPRTLR